MIVGKVTPPVDLQPAFDALGEKGKSYALDLLAMNNGKLEPWILAQAADYERGEFKVQ